MLAALHGRIGIPLLAMHCMLYASHWLTWICACSRQPAAFDFGAPAPTDDWLGFTSQANDNWDLPQGGGAYINNGFQNAGGYYQQGGGGGYQQQPPQQGGGYYQNGGGYSNQSNGSGGGYYGSGYMNGGGYINNSNGTAMYGQYTSGNGRRGEAIPVAVHKAGACLRRPV